MHWLWVVLIALFCIAAGGFAGYQYRKQEAEKKIGRAEELATKLYEDAVHKAEDFKKEKILEMNIEDLDLSVRSYNCLKAAEIRTVRDLLMYTRPQLLKMRNFGRKSIAEIDRMLDKLSERTGLTLSYGMIPPPYGHHTS